MHTMECDRLVDEELKDGVAVGDAHLELGKISSGLHHFMPEVIHLPLRDVKGIAVWTDCYGLGSWRSEHS